MTATNIEMFWAETWDYAIITTNVCTTTSNNAGEVLAQSTEAKAARHNVCYAGFGLESHERNP